MESKRDGKRHSKIQTRLNLLLLVCLVPLGIMVVYLLISVNHFSERYDVIVENITSASAYNIEFKDEIDYIMYIIVINSERADELVDVNQPHEMIADAQDSFQELYEQSEDDYARAQLQRILKSLSNLDECIVEIETAAKEDGSYDENMERLDLNIRVLTELFQEQVQQFIYYETTNLEVLREGIRADVINVIRTCVIVFALILIGAFTINKMIMKSITTPIRNLREMANQVGEGDFAVRVEDGASDDELVALNASFNQMVAHIDNLVDGIRQEQNNLRATELKLLQAQINPHFLYNTLDAIIWLAEAGKTQEVVGMVSSLSDFFRIGLSKGRDYISVQEEEKHVRSYLQIQQYRYSDILEYEIAIPEELYQYQVLKLTLQPLVENALYHGIKNKRGIGHIHVNGELRGEELFFVVEDDGRGMEPDRLEYVRRAINGTKMEDDGSGFGLANVAQRIRLNYGAQYGLELFSEYDRGTRACVRIPALNFEHLS